MRNDRLLGWCAAFVLSLSFSIRWVPAQEAQQSDPSRWTKAEKAEFMLKAQVGRQRGTGRGITNSTRATFSDERGTHDVHIQTINEYKQRFETPMGTEINFKDTYKFNLAAYLLDQILELNMIPVTVERKVGGRAAAVTWWVDDVLMTELDRKQKNVSPPDAERWNRQMYILRVFDQLIANTDRNLGNVVITNNWDLWMIDHTRAFRSYKTLLEPKNLVKCDRSLLAAMRKLDKDTLKDKLGKYLNGMEIDGLLARRDKIVEIFEEKVASEGEGEVMYDYLTERRSAQTSK